VDAVTGIEVLRDREKLFGPVASMPTAWRLLDRIDAAHLPLARAARERAWAAGAAPDAGPELRIDFDATITIAHSEKQNAAATWKKPSASIHCWRFGPARGDERGGVGRAAACRQRGQQHCGGPRDGAGYRA